MRDPIVPDESELDLVLARLSTDERAWIDLTFWTGEAVERRDLLPIAVALGRRNARRAIATLPIWFVPVIVTSGVLAFVVEDNAYALFVYLLLSTGALASALWWWSAWRPARRMEAVNRAALESGAAPAQWHARPRVVRWGLVIIGLWSTATVVGYALRSTSTTSTLIAFAVLFVAVAMVAARRSRSATRSISGRRR